MTNKKIIKLYGGEVIIAFYPDSHRFRELDKDLKPKTSQYLISASTIVGSADKSAQLVKAAIREDIGYLKRFVESKGEEMINPIEMQDALITAETYHEKLWAKARDTGSDAHEWFQKFAKAKIAGKDTPDYPEKADKQLVSAIDAMREWYLKNKVTFVDTERVLFSKHYGFVGIADVIAYLNGKLVVADYKTSKDIYDTHKLQNDLYRYAFVEEMKYLNENSKTNLPYHNNPKFFVKDLVNVEGSAILHMPKDGGFGEPYENYKKIDYVKNVRAAIGLYAYAKRNKELQKEYWAKQ